MIDNIPNLYTPPKVMMKIAEATKARRLELNLTQSAMARRSDMSLSSYRRFETTGDISLKNLVNIAFVLDAVDGFLELFSRKQYRSISEILQAKEVSNRKRGTRND